MLYIENGEMKMNITRGDIYYADLSPVVGSEQGGVRPVLIVQNDVGNRYSPTVIAAAITSRIDKVKLPTHIEVSRASCSIDGDGAGLQRDSVILLEQIRTLDNRRLKERIGHLGEEVMAQVNAAISVSFGLTPTAAPSPAVTPSAPPLSAAVDGAVTA
jgi:mRNA interferase MazF